jgi:hypothetical protein
VDFGGNNFLSLSEAKVFLCLHHDAGGEYEQSKKDFFVHRFSGLRLSVYLQLSDLYCKYSFYFEISGIERVNIDKQHLCADGPKKRDAFNASLG